MDPSTDLEKTVTGTSVQENGEKAVDVQESAGVEDGEKAIDSTTTLSNPPPPVAEAGGVNEPATLAAESLQICAAGFTDAPPPLPFSCWDHKLSICVFWFFILAEACFIPESFYYGLTFGTTLNHGACKSWTPLADSIKLANSLTE
jgi:hypothetical protein